MQSVVRVAAKERLGAVSAPADALAAFTSEPLMPEPVGGASLAAPTGQASAEAAAVATRALAAIRTPLARRSDVHAESLLAWLNSVRFFRDNCSSNAMRREIGQGVQAVEFAKGNVVCMQGDFGDEFYVVLEGEVEVAVNGHSVGTLDAGQGFGDRALSTKKASRRTASVVAKTPIVLASLAASLYHKLVDSVSQSEMTKFGGLLALGQVEFANGRAVRDVNAPTLQESRQAKLLRLETAESADFVELDADAQYQRVKMLRDVVDLMKYTWRMPMPNVIFSITGGATPFTLRPKIEKMFEKTLLNATRSTTGLIVTGGTNIGVMKLVGDSIARSGRMETCLGIMPWGTIHGRNA